MKYEYWFWFWFWLGCAPSIASAKFTLRDPSSPWDMIVKLDRPHKRLPGGGSTKSVVREPAAEVVKSANSTSRVDTCALLRARLVHQVRLIEHPFEIIAGVLLETLSEPSWGTSRATRARFLGGGRVDTLSGPDVSALIGTPRSVIEVFVPLLTCLFYSLSESRTV